MYVYLVEYDLLITTIGPLLKAFFGHDHAPRRCDVHTTHCELKIYKMDDAFFILLSKNLFYKLGVKVLRKTKNHI